MARNRKLAAAGGTRERSRLKRLLAIVPLLFCLAAQAQTAPSAADAALDSAVAHAKLQQWQQAEEILLQAHEQFPRDARFPAELAGVYFRQKQNGRARHWLHKAADLDPQDAYVADFLATLYFLDDNLEAALKHWNRAGKPRLADVRLDAPSSVSPVLLDRAISAAPGEQLTLSQLLHSRTTLQAMNLFSHVRMTLSQAATPAEKNLTVAVAQPAGWRESKLMFTLRTLRGLADQSVHPEVYNIGGSGVTATSMLRWDRERQRVRVAVTRPLFAQPQWVLGLVADARREEWALGAAATAPSFRQERIGVRFGIAHTASARCAWQTGVEVNRRKFQQASGASYFATGRGFQADVGGNCDVLYIPERRVRVNVGLLGTTGAVRADSTLRFATLEPAAKLEWLPQASGDRYKLQSQVLSRVVAGTLPFDQFRVLGLDSDSGLLLRAHKAYNDGRRGRAPVARSYVALRNEFDARVFRRLALQVSLGPFFDVARAAPALPTPSQPRWFADAGVQMKVTAFNHFGIVLLYGRDLRAGTGAFHAGSLGR